jgi:hypothetical protein
MLDAPATDGAVRETPRRRRSLAPREHGAYGELAVPMLAALASGRPGLASVLLALSAWAVFLAHEPVLVLLARRGPRVRLEEGPRAARRLAVLGGAAATLGAAGFLVAPLAARWALLAPAVLGTAFAILVALGRERSAVGEVLAAVALSSVAFPIAIASGASPLEAVRAGCVWALGLSALVLPVRGIGAQRRSRGSPGATVLPALGACTLAAGLVGWIFVPMDLVALAPLILASVWLATAPPGPRQLRRVGWSLVGSMLLTAGLLVLEKRS